MIYGKEGVCVADKPESYTTVYEQAVRGRREFRTAYRSAMIENRKLRDALDRIARFSESYEEATEKCGHDGRHAGPALCVVLGRYAREAIKLDRERP
jgi:hypothetical protein